MTYLNLILTFSIVKTASLGISPSVLSIATIGMKVLTSEYNQASSRSDLKPTDEQSLMGSWSWRTGVAVKSNVTYFFLSKPLFLVWAPSILVITLWTEICTNMVDTARYEFNQEGRYHQNIILFLYRDLNSHLIPETSLIQAFLIV